MVSVMNQEKKNYLLGILGSILGGMILTIPWVLIYVYGNMMFSLLAIFIAWGALKGYILMKGTIDLKLPTIITIVSLICVSVAVLIIIPFMLLYKEGYAVSIENFQILYETSSFTSALIKDYIISVVFTLLGISGVVSNIRNQILANKDVKIDFSNQSVNNLQKENIKAFKEVFLKYNAFSKKNTISKDKVLEEVKIDTIDQEKICFRNLKIGQYIKKYHGNYYWSLKNENSFIRRFLILYGKIMLMICVIAFLLVIVLI